MQSRIHQENRAGDSPGVHISINARDEKGFYFSSLHSSFAKCPLHLQSCGSYSVYLSYDVSETESWQKYTADQPRSKSSKIFLMQETKMPCSSYYSCFKTLQESRLPRLARLAYLSSCELVLVSLFVTFLLPLERKPGSSVQLYSFMASQSLAEHRLHVYFTLQDLTESASPFSELIFFKSCPQALL